MRWLPTAEAVAAEVERQAGHRQLVAALDAEIKALQVRKSAAVAALDLRPGWASDHGRLTARQQLRVWEAAARSAHPLYLDGGRIYELRSGCLYESGGGTGSIGERIRRDGDRVVRRGAVLRPVSREEAAEVVERLRSIVARLDGAPDAS